jgi:acyl carrier protein
MTDSEILARLTPVFRDVFDDDRIVLRPEMSARDVDGWDSVANIRLMVTIEGEFGVSFDWFVKRSVSNGCLWYPSTVFLARPDPHFAEYVAAKACGEALCVQLNGQLAPRRVVVERLPRLPTDQTQGLSELQTDDSIAAMRAALLRCAMTP